MWWLVGSIFLLLVAFLAVPPIRQNTVSRLALAVFKRVMPRMSRTEREALEAGSVTFEGEIFSGRPDFKALFAAKSVRLSNEEQTFLDGPVKTLCQMVDDWEISHKTGDLSPEVWRFIKERGFLGIIIPKRYGGLEFSGWAHASIIMRVGSKSLPTAITVAVPNSLGPAELLLKYGTEAQKDYYLPRLARGDEIPCFALTAPRAGSDAASITDSGVVCYGEFDGQRVLGIKLTWDKRYITLAPVATLIGLAFRLNDPDHLIGNVEDIGITCALVPANLPGISIGRRHNPLHVYFQNGPTQGKDVFVPLDAIIGGQKMAGQGWRMLMECLAAGRGITLPSSASAAAMHSALVSGAYARLRSQFGLPIGRFEGIEEALARIAADAYFNTSALRMNIAAIDAGHHPSVASAIVKYHTTERGRQAVNDAMDIHGGKGISLGPNNYLAPLFFGAPINITVEGANILTRNLIIFGQGAIRCHPYVMREIKASRDNDLKAFDQAIVGHGWHVFVNMARAFLLAWLPSRTKNYRRHLSRFSSAFAFSADVAMVTLGGALKRKESLSARLGDVLSQIYCASAVLKRFHDDGSPKDDRPLVDFVVQRALYDIQKAFAGVIRNYPNRLVAAALKLVIFPLGYRFKQPHDYLSHQLAQLLMTPSAARDRLTAGVERIELLEDALEQIVACEPLEKKLYQAKKDKLIDGRTRAQMAKQAHAKQILNEQELRQLLDLDALIARIIAVDDFLPTEILAQK